MGAKPGLVCGKGCKVRGFLKAGLASAAHLTGADRLYGAYARQRREAVVLGYHRVVADFDREASYAFPSMLISRAMLERHLDWMARRFQIVSLDDLRSRLEALAPRARPLAAITFDDGYRDVYEQAFPLLKRKGIPAAVFVATNYVDTSGVLPHDRLYLLLARASHRWSFFTRQLLALLQRLELPLPAPAVVAAATSVQSALRTLITSLSETDVQRIITALEVDCGLSGGLPNGFRPMTWSMLTEMSRAGIVVGSHTKSHSLLTNEAAGKGGRGDGRVAAGTGRQTRAAGLELCVSGRPLRSRRRPRGGRRRLPDRRHHLPASRSRSSVAHGAAAPAVGAVECRHARADSLLRFSVVR